MVRFWELQPSLRGQQDADGLEAAHDPQAFPSQEDKGRVELEAARQNRNQHPSQPDASPDRPLCPVLDLNQRL